MEFYVYLNGEKRGPLDQERVQALLTERVLQGSDLASDSADGEWRPLASFRRFQAPDAPVEAEAVAVPVAPPPAPAPTPPPPPVGRDALGPYARSTLAPDETPCYKTSLHWIIFVRFAGVAVVMFVFLALPFAIGLQALTGLEFGWFALPLPALAMLPPTFAFASSELVITDRRVLIKTGVLRRQTREVFIAKVESIGVDQGFFGRMFDYGTVVIRGTGGFEEPFEAIARPLEFRRWIQQLQSGTGVHH
jgi:membrane protein YdbS with pleckstrin-like domain